jgi:hypothetical protein
VRFIIGDLSVTSSLSICTFEAHEFVVLAEAGYEFLVRGALPDLLAVVRHDFLRRRLPTSADHGRQRRTPRARSRAKTGPFSALRLGRGPARTLMS